MLNWCQNRPHNQSYSQILIPQAPEIIPSSSHPPKFANRSQKQIRKIKPTPRCGPISIIDPIKTISQEVQTIPEIIFKPILVNSSTQTPKINLELSLCCNGHTQTTSRLPTPSNLLDNSAYLRFNSLKPDEFADYDRSRKQSGDYKWENNNVRTKATYCLVDTKQMQFCEKGRQGVRGVESYHLPSSSQLSGCSPRERNVCFKESQIIKGSPSIMFSSNQDQDDLNFSSKYWDVYRNVERQFKHSREKSEKQKSLKSLKYTPERPDRRLLYERDTIMSKFAESHARSSSKEIVIEQSVIVERNVGSFFTPLTEICHYSWYCLYLAREDQLGLIVSIKQFDIHQMNFISQELLIYKEMQTKEKFYQGILSLYQTQIDRNCYMLIKEPFTRTIKVYLECKPDLSKMIHQVHQTLQQMRDSGFLLRRNLRVEDLVQMNEKIKIQNAGVFTLDRTLDSITVDEAILNLRSELLWYCE